jgi:hypothetical protein
MTMEPEEFVSSLKPELRARVKELQSLQEQHSELEKAFRKERAELEAKYAKLYGETAVKDRAVLACQHEYKLGGVGPQPPKALFFRRWPYFHTRDDPRPPCLQPLCTALAVRLCLETVTCRFLRARWLPQAPLVRAACPCTPQLPTHKSLLITTSLPHLIGYAPFQSATNAQRTPCLHVCACTSYAHSPSISHLLMYVCMQMMTRASLASGQPY